MTAFIPLATKITAETTLSAGKTPLRPSSCSVFYHLLTILRKKDTKRTLRKTVGIYLQMKIGEKSVVILGRANYSSRVITSIQMEQVLCDESLKSYFPKISEKFKCQDLMTLQRLGASGEPSALSGSADGACALGTPGPPVAPWLLDQGSLASPALVGGPWLPAPRSPKSHSLTPAECHPRGSGCGRRT